MNLIALKKFIREQGWSDFGIVSYNDLFEKLKEHRFIFENWLQKSFHADMNYLADMKEDRYEPKKKLPTIKSVITLTAWYAQASLPPNSIQSDQKSVDAGSGIIARYARGKDYHKQLKKKLIALSDFLKIQNPELTVENYVSVDSGPIVDRVLAECAGLGFFGKNACIINPSKGSYFFIANLYTSLDLNPTPKLKMPNCGNCTQCADACPTGALVAPGQVDARRCISYLTIENKGGIPIDLRPLIGARLFGCDICQEVCPFNLGRAHRQEILIENLKGKYGAGESLNLKDVLSIKNDEDYLKMFAGTPLMRAKRRGLIRNACVVAGNSGEVSLIPYLERIVLEEEDEMLKEHAEWGIRQLSG